MPCCVTAPQPSWNKHMHSGYFGRSRHHFSARCALALLFLEFRVGIVKASRDDAEESPQFQRRTVSRTKAPFEEEKRLIENSLKEGAEAVMASADQAERLTQNVAGGLATYHTDVQNIGEDVQAVTSAGAELHHSYWEELFHNEPDRLAPLNNIDWNADMGGLTDSADFSYQRGTADSESRGSASVHSASEQISPQISPQLGARDNGIGRKIEMPEFFSSASAQEGRQGINSTLEEEANFSRELRPGIHNSSAFLVKQHGEGNSLSPLSQEREQQSQGESVLDNLVAHPTVDEPRVASRQSQIGDITSDDLQEEEFADDPLRQGSADELGEFQEESGRTDQLSSLFQVLSKDDEEVEDDQDLSRKQRGHRRAHHIEAKAAQARKSKARYRSAREAPERMNHENRAKKVVHARKARKALEFVSNRAKEHKDGSSWLQKFESSRKLHRGGSSKFREKVYHKRGRRHHGGHKLRRHHEDTAKHLQKLRHRLSLIDS